MSDDPLVCAFQACGLLDCRAFTADTVVAFASTRGFDLARSVIEHVARFPRGAERLADDPLYRQINAFVTAAPILAAHWNVISPLQEAVRPGLGTVRYSLAECVAISAVTATLCGLLHRVQRLEIA